MTVAATVPAPSVIGTIARKELVEMLRDDRFKWTAAIMSLLLLTALVTGWERFNAYQNMRNHAQEEINEQFATQQNKHPHSGAHYGTYALKQAGALAFFDSGVANYSGNLVWIVAHNQNAAISRPANDLSALTRFGDLDGAMLLQVLMPLMIIFLGFTAFAGERERGTLRQVIAMGVSPRDVLWGKTLGIGAGVLIVLIPCLIVGAAVLLIAGVPDTADGLGLRVGFTIISYAIYGGIFLFVTLAVSALARTAQSALLILVASWIFAAFLMPKVAVEISKVIYPSPTVGEFMANLQHDIVHGLHGDPPKKRLEEYQHAVWAKYGVTGNADLPVGWLGLLLQKLEDMDHEVFDFYYGSQRRIYLAQRRLQDAIGILDPLLPLTSLSSGLAGTDLVHQDRFTIAAENHRRQMIQRVNTYLTEGAVSDNRYSNPREARYVAGPEFFGSIGRFSYESPALIEVISEYQWDFVILTAWLIASMYLALYAVRRMGV